MSKVKKIQVEEFSISTGERSGEVFGYFSSVDVGRTATANKGWYGANGSHSGTVNALVFEIEGEEYVFLEKDRIEIFHTVQDVESAETESRRQQALSKLSDEDKEVLGLK